MAERPQAADRIGIHEKRLRRLLTRTETRNVVMSEFYERFLTEKDALLAERQTRIGSLERDKQRQILERRD